LGAAADNTNYLRDKTFAQWIALNRVAEQRLQGRMPSRGKTNGETEFAGNRWQWEQEVTELEVPGVLRMDVKVRIANAGGSSSSQNKNWMGNALGVMGDAIGPPISPLDIPQSWEMPPAAPGGEGSGDGSNNGNNSDNTNNNNNNNPGNNNTDGNSDQPETPPPPGGNEQE
jgi:type II secretion system protein I